MSPIFSLMLQNPAGIFGDIMIFVYHNRMRKKFKYIDCIIWMRQHKQFQLYNFLKSLRVDFCLSLLKII